MAKLTLNVDPEVIAGAKQYAAAHGTSLSKMFTRYLKIVTEKREKRSDTPITDELYGCLKGAIPDDVDYRDILIEKYL